MAGSPTRVLIADEISRIVSTLDMLAPFGDEIEPCGMARDAATLLEETRRLQPDVILLNPDVAGDDPRRSLGEASPLTQVVVLRSGDDGHGAGSLPPAGWHVIGPEVTGRELVRVIQQVRPHQAAPVAQPEAIPPLAPRRARRTAPDGGEIFLVFAGKGGVGKSMVAANLAVALRMDTRTRVALVDLDLQFGDLALMLGLENHPDTIEVLSQDGDLVDAQLLARVLVSGPEGVRALLAPESPERAELITPPALRAILRELRRGHDHIVIDGPAHLNEQTLEVIDLADHILVVTSYSLTAVKDTRIMVRLLRSLGVDRDRISIVLNQTRARATLLPEDVEERLGLRVRSHLPFEHRIVDDAVDRGLPFVISEPDAEITRRMHWLAGFLASPAIAAMAVEAQHDSDGGARVHPLRRRFGIGRREHSA